MSSFLSQAQGRALAAMTWFAASDWPDKLRMRKANEKILYHGAKAGFKLAATASRTFAPKKPAGERARLSSSTPPSLFDLSLSDEQTMIAESLRVFALEQIRPAAHEADKARRIDAALRAQFTELGLVNYATPEALGGVGGEANQVTQVLALEALGYGDFAMGAGLFAPVAVANMLTRYASAAVQTQYLTALNDEDKGLVAALACDEAWVGFNPMQPHTRARLDGETYVLDGVKTLVLQAAQAELFVVSAVFDGAPALFVVESGNAGVALSDAPAMGLRASATATLQLHEVRVPLANKITVDYRQCLDLSHLALCALSVGTAQAVVDYVVRYANDRKAFGEPIAHRQAVAFMIADAATEVEAMRLMVWRAAALAEQGKPFHREAHLAHVFCVDKAMTIANDGVQILGGHGFTQEHPVERWYRDLRSVGAMHQLISL